MEIISKIESTKGNARATNFNLSNGKVQTPLFMPVGTRGAVKLLDASDLEKVKAQIVLGNTYHLMLRPGAEIVEKLGGLNRFMGWNGKNQNTLTDSGGFQVFSLKPKISKHGVVFNSTYDGSKISFSPEDAVNVQFKLGANIQMVLDICVALPASYEKVKEGVEITSSWAKRARAEFLKDERSTSISQFGIVQGGIDKELRKRSAQEIVEIGFDGYAIGGLSVGESRSQMLDTLGEVLQYLPHDKPRYIMGLGDAVGSLQAIDLGVDMMDCVLPTRLARHGGAFTDDELDQTKDSKIIISNKIFEKDESPIDSKCSCSVCKNYSKGYIRHLLKQAEPTGARLMSLHNVSWLIEKFNQKRLEILK